MELVFISHGHLFDLHYLATWFSIVVVVGGVYGALRFIYDLIRGMRRFFGVGESKTPPPN